MFWLFAAILTVITGLAILLPFLRKGAGVAEPAAAYDLRVYRDQLAEVDRDSARQIIEPAEAERLRAEIGRKVLDADRRLHQTGAVPGSGARHALIAALILAALIAGGAGLYASLGAPGLPDMALKDRIASAEARYASRPSQAEAEALRAAIPTEPAAAPDDDFAALIEELRAAVAERPDDPVGLSLLARNEARLGNVLAAKDAQQRLVTLRGQSATAEDHAFLAGIMTEAAGGLITADAETQIARALQLDPANAQARYMTGLLQAQNGRPDRAFQVWAPLLQDSAPDSPWAMAITMVIGDLAWLAGQPDYVPPSATAAMPGPDADAIAAASELSPEEQQDMIRGMVAGLESDLATEGGTPEEWARLIASLGILGETRRAAIIHQEARMHFADLPDALATVDAAARRAGVLQ